MNQCQTARKGRAGVRIEEAMTYDDVIRAVLPLTRVVDRPIFLEVVVHGQQEVPGQVFGENGTCFKINGNREYYLLRGGAITMFQTRIEHHGESTIIRRQRRELTRRRWPEHFSVQEMRDAFKDLIHERIGRHRAKIDTLEQGLVGLLVR